jgi:hypothetical protein
MLTKVKAIAVMDMPKKVADTVGQKQQRRPLKAALSLGHISKRILSNYCF